MAGNRLSTEILINLAGNLQAKARQYGTSMSEFSSRSSRAMSLFKATTEAAGRGLDRLGNRYTGLIASVAGGAALREFAQVDRRMTRLGIAAEKTKDEMHQILSDTRDAAIKFRVDDSEVVGAIEKINTVTGDLEFGIKNKEMLSASIAASGSDGESIGGLFSQFPKYGLQTEKQTLAAMDTLNQLGKEGAFELKDIAEKGVRALSMYASAGGNDVEGIKDIGVILESAIDVTGNRDTAATATENLIRDLQLPKVVKTLRHNGVNVYDRDGRMRSLPKLLEEIARKSGSKGAEKQNARLLEAGFNQDSILLIGSVTSGKGAENLKRYQSVVADGKGIMDDAQYAAQDFTSAMTSLNVIWKKFADSNLAKPVQELADALNGMEPATVQRWLEVGKYLTVAVGGIIAARKAFQIGKGTWDFIDKHWNKKGKKGGVAGGIADVFGSGVMPVYVVNMGAGGMGGGITDALGEAGGRGGRGPGRFGRLARGAGIFAGITGAGFALYDHLESNYRLDGRVDDLTKQVAGDKNASVQERAFAEESQRNRQALENKWKQWFGGDDAPQAKVVDPRPWATMTPAIPAVNFASIPAPSDPKGPTIPQIKSDEHSLWAAIADFFKGANTTIESGMPSVTQEDNAPQLPPVPPKLQGEIRVIVEGDARVKSVKMDQPGVTLSASAGVSNVEQN